MLHTNESDLRRTWVSVEVAIGQLRCAIFFFNTCLLHVVLVLSAVPTAQNGWMVNKLPPVAFSNVFCISMQVRLSQCQCLRIVSRLRLLARRSSFFCVLFPCDSLRGLPSSIIVSSKKNIRPACGKLQRGLKQPTRFQRQNTIEKWNLMKPQDSCWNHLYQTFTKTTLQAKESTQ